MVDNKPKFMSKRWFDDFFIPRNLVDVIFIVICFVLAWYAFKYDIPAAKTPIICANLWNEWSAENAAFFHGLNITPASDLDNLGCKNINISEIRDFNIT